MSAARQVERRSPLIHTLPTKYETDNSEVSRLGITSSYEVNNYSLIMIRICHEEEVGSVSPRWNLASDVVKRAREKWASESQGHGRAQFGDVIAEQWLRAESGPASTESTGTCSGDKRRRTM